MHIIHLNYPLQFPITNFPKRKQVMAIGDFDGLHLGHQDVINHAKYIADKQQVHTAIMTFNPHPREVLGQSQYARYLAPFDKKMKLFEDQGVDYCYVVSFNKSFAKVSPEDFILQMLLLLHIHTVVVGFDFTFGHRGLGTVETLKELCTQHMDVEVVKPFHMGGSKVSSTLIREQLHLGRLDRVKKYLGRNYYIGGLVIEGEARGRTIGFPTANLEVVEPYVIPRHGVYAVRIRIIQDQQAYRGVMNIGFKPTFSSDEINPTLEVHILDFDQNIYGKHVSIEFIAFLRDEQKFASVDSLVNQINEDIQQAELIFSDQ